ncbi:hypothetical protein KF913_24385 [Candidatus Obscuribacterales bacterium]|nr:hypothetical protein [Candidatus Obscuribacterales bacterium]
MQQSVLKEDKGLFYCCIAVVAIMTARLAFAVAIHPLRIGWDPALHLQIAQMITQGKIPYVDMSDANPPLVWYLYTIPAFGSELFNIPVTLAFNYFLVVLIVYSVVTCLMLFFRHAKRAEAPFFLPFLVGLTLFNFFLRYDFGQREEIFVLLYMPYLVLRTLRWQERGVQSKVWSAAIGFMAAIGICIKPHFLIPVFLVELYFLLDKWRWRKLVSTENIACFGGGVLYLAHFLFVPKAMNDAYWKFVVPAFALGYHYWDTSLAASFSDPGKRDVFFLTTVACLLAVALRKRCSFLLPLTVFVFGSIIPYLIQFKGWGYHDQPVYAGAFILFSMEVGYFIFFGWKLLESAVSKFSTRFSKSPVSISHRITLGLIVVSALAIAFRDGQEDYKIVVEDPRHFDLKTIGYQGSSPWADIHSPYTSLVLDGYKLGDKVIVMSNAVSPGYPWLTQLRFEPGSRHLHMVILSVLSYIKDILPHTPHNDNLSSQMPRIVNEYAEDIQKNKPRFIFMQKGPDYFDEPYKFVSKYLSADYDELEQIENFRTFRRKPGK